MNVFITSPAANAVTTDTMAHRRSGRYQAMLLASAGLLLLGGCASSGAPREAAQEVSSQDGRSGVKGDPLEGYNRAIYSFNDTVDRYALKPVASAYRDYTPSFFQTAVGNFFGNLRDLYSAMNGILQGNGEGAGLDVARVALNSSFGLLGLLDIATEAGIPRQNRDFGQTLGRYGVGAGPYIVLPLLGPSTLRDTAALPVDFYGDAWSYMDPVYIRNIGTGVRIVDKRAALLNATGLVEDAALDKYAFTRDAYMQYRASQIEQARHPEDFQLDPRAQAQ